MSNANISRRLSSIEAAMPPEPTEEQLRRAYAWLVGSLDARRLSEAASTINEPINEPIIGYTAEQAVADAAVCQRVANELRGGTLPADPAAWIAMLPHAAAKAIVAIERVWMERGELRV